jgi:hypothetical protein
MEAVSQKRVSRHRSDDLPATLKKEFGGFEAKTGRASSDQNGFHKHSITGPQESKATFKDIKATRIAKAFGSGTKGQGHATSVHGALDPILTGR